MSVAVIIYCVCMKKKREEPAAAKRSIFVLQSGNKEQDDQVIRPSEGKKNRD